MNVFLSDLFFNHDVSQAKLFDPAKGVFTGYDQDKLRVIAEDFLGTLGELGVKNLPKPDELAQDFLGRL